MTVYIWIVAISVAMTIGTFFHHALLRNWYDVFLALPIWLGWFLAATALYFLLLYLISLTVDKSKPVRKKSRFPLAAESDGMADSASGTGRDSMHRA